MEQLKEYLPWTNLYYKQILNCEFREIRVVIIYDRTTDSYSFEANDECRGARLFWFPVVWVLFLSVFILHHAPNVPHVSEMSIL